MAMLPSSFNQKEHEDLVFTPIESGTYLAVIVGSEMKETKDKTGKMLVLQFSILDGKYKSRKIFVRLNLINKSADAVAIANRELATICRAMGITHSIADSNELHGNPVYLKVELTSDGKYNEVKGYTSARGDEPSSVPQQNSEKSSAKKPWE